MMDEDRIPERFAKLGDRTPYVNVARHIKERKRNGRVVSPAMVRHGFAAWASARCSRASHIFPFHAAVATRPLRVAAAASASCVCPHAAVSLYPPPYRSRGCPPSPHATLLRTSPPPLSIHPASSPTCCCPPAPLSSSTSLVPSLSPLIFHLAAALPLSSPSRSSD